MQQTQIDFEKQQEHLKNVSRTFALTIPMLPESLIDYISNAYLLCRIADTVEDDPIAPTKQKIAWLVSFAQFCSNDFSDDMQLLSLHKQAVELVQKGSKTTEFELIKDMQGVITRTRSFPRKVQMILSKGVSILSYGMAQSLQGLNIKDVDDVDKYCYYVAGVVGELLAALFCEYNHTIDKHALMILSVSFGEGLQLTNILKDRVEDKMRNVSFLPVVADSEYKKMVEYYIALCQGHLDDALAFICKVPTGEYGIRLFCLLNIAMATATLKLISKSDLLDEKKPKISRNKVKFLYVLSKFCAKNNFLTVCFFKMLSRGVKRERRSALELRDKVSCWEQKITDFTIEDND